MILADILNRNKIKVKLYNKDLYIKKMTFEDAVKAFFLLIPYVKLLKEAKREYGSDNTISTFTFIVNVLLSELDKDILYEVLSIIYGGMNVDILKAIEIQELSKSLSILIRQNNLIELFILFKNMGLYNG